jgi:hypothetical protein
LRRVAFRAFREFIDRTSHLALLVDVELIA